MICRLAEQASTAASPDEALRLTRALREEIDTFERQQVARALTAGGSVASVARALGVTRQSAHRRFRELIAPRKRDGRPQPTPELRLVVEHAREEARELAAPAVGSEHLLVGILRSGEHPAVAALNRLGLEYDSARRAAGTVSATARGNADLKKVLVEALHAAHRDGCDQIGVDHVLLAALRDPASGASATVCELGVVPEAVLTALADEIAAT